MEAAEAAFRKLVSLCTGLQDDGIASFLSVFVTSGSSKFPDLAVRQLLTTTLNELEDDMSTRSADDVKSSRLSWLAAKMTILKAVVSGAGFTSHVSCRRGGVEPSLCISSEVLCNEHLPMGVRHYVIIICRCTQLRATPATRGQCCCQDVIYQQNHLLYRT